MTRPGADKGQATVEFVLALPVLMLFLLAVVQVGLVVRDQISVIHAAREGARAASVDDTGGPGGAAAAGVARAGGLDPARREVATSVHDGLATVTVSYRAPTDVPIIGPLLPDRTVTASVTMALEPTS